MEENVGGGDQLNNQNEVAVGGPPKSPWKTSASASLVTESDSDSWPALSDAQQRSKNNVGVDSNSAKSPPPMPDQPKGNDSRAGPPPLATAEQQKFHGRGNIRYPRKPYHQNRTSPKYGPPNSVPSFPVPLPNYPPIFHPMVPMSPVASTGYVYPFPPAPASVPSANGVQTSPASDSSSADSTSTGRRPDANEQGGRTNTSWNNQRPVGNNSNNFHVQKSMGPRPFMRPPFFGPTGFADGPNYPSI